MTSTAPRPIIRGTKTIEEKRQYDYSKGVLPYVPEEVDDFETEATRYLNGEWPSLRRNSSCTGSCAGSTDNARRTFR